MSQQSTDKIDLAVVNARARQEIRRFYESQLETRRKLLESPKCDEKQGDVLRGRIAEIRDLLRRMEDQPAQPTWLSGAFE